MPYCHLETLLIHIAPELVGKKKESVIFRAKGNGPEQSCSVLVLVWFFLLLIYEKLKPRRGLRVKQLVSNR